MSNTDIPETIQKRFGSQVKFEQGEEVRMGWYSDGTLSIDAFRVVISGPFVASLDGRYLAGTRQFQKVAVIVDLLGKQEESFVAGNETVQARDFQNDTFRFEHNIGTPELTANLLELKLGNIFGPQSSNTPNSDFTRLSHPED
jgi:hypothetical protein